MLICKPDSIKISALQDILPCSELKVDRHFGGTYSLLLYDLKISEARNQSDAGNTARLMKMWDLKILPASE